MSAVDSPRVRARPVHFLLLALIGAMALVLGVHFATNRPVANAATISGSQTRSAFTVAAGDTLVFDPNQNTTLTMTGNLIVRGTLIMKPANGNIRHTIRFTGINENNFVGGGMTPLASDIGLWVVGAGRIVLQGESKPAWAYSWQPSWDDDDAIVAAPNTSGNRTTFTQVTSTPAKNALGYPTELLNLSRNVRIEGTETGYTHVFIMSSQPSSIRNATFRYMAPDFGSSDVTGRYGLHIHMSGNGSRGTIVDGLLVRDTKGHAFVPHLSNGITFRNTIAYNVRGEAYWWDEGASSDDIIFDRAVVAGMRATANPSNSHRLGAFYLGQGDDVTVTNSVVVGMRREDGASRSGYIWPEDDEATWTFKNNRAHNNETNGIFVWQNNELPHVIDGFIAYYNDQAGVEHGAYTNSYVYKNLTLLANGTAVHSHAMGEPGDGGVDTQIWSNIKTRGGTLVIDEHARDAERPVRFLVCDFGEVQVDDSGGAEPSEYDFINCGLEPSDFDLSGARSDSVFRVQRSNGSAYRLMGNGSVTSIGRFYNGPLPGKGPTVCPAPAKAPADLRGIGDFNGNGRSDAFFYDSAGRWWVDASTGSSFDRELWSQFSTASGWSSHLVGDFNEDGRDDVVSYHPGSGNLVVSRSTTSGFSNSVWSTFSTKSGWGKQLVGDFNGDGRDDVASYHPGSGNWVVSRSTGSGFSNSVWSTFSTKSGWTRQLVGDFNGDGLSDIANYHPGSGNWVVSRSTGSGFSNSVWSNFSTRCGWKSQVVGDFNNDGRDDIANYHPGNGNWVVSRSTGSGFANSVWSTFSTKSGWGQQVVGDFNNDGRDDIANYHPGNGNWVVSRSTGSGFANSVWSTFSTKSGWVRQLVGDFNEDGRADIANLHSNGNWVVSRSTGSNFSNSVWYP